MFVDSAKIKVKSGDGGKGCESFFRRTDKKTVPNGGHGGGGGDIIFEADRNESNLQFYSFRHFFEARKGDAGSSNQKAGKKGADLTLKVPCGTSIYNLEKDFLIRDLIQHGDRVIALKGGRGGCGNDHIRQATEGKPGEEMELLLDYVLVSDIFLVGMPNSGKSSLLRAITGSKVKSESYPFSTRVPQLGTYETDKYDRLTICELPSLERGSYEGKGLGNLFLKHLRRAKLIFFVLDPISDFAQDLKLQKEVLEDEIGRFDESLNQIPHFYVINKLDLVTNSKGMGKKVFGSYTFYVSSVSGEGISHLMRQAEIYITEQRSKSKGAFEV